MKLHISTTALAAISMVAVVLLVLYMVVSFLAGEALALIVVGAAALMGIGDAIIIYLAFFAKKKHLPLMTEDLKDDFPLAKMTSSINMVAKRDDPWGKFSG